MPAAGGAKLGHPTEGSKTTRQGSPPPIPTATLLAVGSTEAIRSVHRTPAELIPLKDENPTEITTYFTVAFLIANIVVWLTVQGGGDPDALLASVTSYGVVPCQITGECPQQGLRFGAVFTSMFMHGSWEHLLGNMLFLWVFGNNIEDSMGHLRFIAFYLICGIAAAVAHIALSPASPLPAVGASGAISGIMGGYIVLYPRVRVFTWFPPFFFFPIRAFFILGYWFLIQLALGVVTMGPEAGEQGGVAVWAHVGGFVAGLVLVKLFEKRQLTYAKTHKIKLSRAEAARLEW
jgi:membrane associated rhomboid family serine protease